MEHEALRELTGVYVLGLLPDDERRAFEEHMTTCPDCAEEVRDMVLVTHALDRAVGREAPPAHVRDRILTSVTGRVPAQSAARPVPVPPRYGPPLSTWAAVAAGIAAVAVGLYALNLRERVRTLQAELINALARVEQAERNFQLVRVQANLAERAAQVLAAADVTRVDLAGQEAAPDATGRAYWSRSRGLVFTATNLPQLPPGTVYQLWLVTRDGRPVSAGVFSPERTDGSAALTVSAVEAIDAAAVAVTLEPAGGVTAPTGQRYLVGRI